MTRKPDSFRPRLEALDERALPSFFSGTSSPVAAGPQAVVAADVNGDGKLDLVTADQGTYDATTGTWTGGGVSVMLGLVNSRGVATGTFGAARNYAVGPSRAVAVGDVNGDSKPDLVAGGGGVLLGNGDGTFRTGPSYAGGADYEKLADLNGDGRLALVTAHNASVSVLLGNGDGTFRAGPTYATDASTTLVVTAGDFNRDGKLDVITATDHGVSLLPGNGDGTFGAAQTVSTFGPDYRPIAVTAADLNADGKLDLAMTLQYSGGTGWDSGIPVNVFMGNGDGTFRGAAVGSIGASGSPTGLLAVADFNHDGKLDLVTVGGGGLMVSVRPGNGDGTFGAEVDYQSASGSVGNPTAFAVGDFNGDGYADIAVAGSSGTVGGGDEVGVFLWNIGSKKSNGW